MGETRTPRFAGLPTFMRRDLDPEPAHADVVVVGAPYDGGTSYRPGARFGPRAIREQSTLLHGAGVGRVHDVFDELHVIDTGDLDLSPFDMELAMEQASTGLAERISRNRVALVLGGDHSITLPALRATAAVHGPLGVLHLDAHSDTFPAVHGGRFHHGTPFRWALEEGLITGDRTVQVGVRGHLPTPDALDWARSRGVTILTAEQIDAHGVDGLRTRVREALGPGPTYVSVDVDVVDPAFAPGTGTPAPGGLSSREVLGLLSVVGDLEPVGFDVVETAPAYDCSGITALLAAEIGYELLHQLARSRRAGR